MSALYLSFRVMTILLQFEPIVRYFDSMLRLLRKMRESHVLFKDLYLVKKAFFCSEIFRALHSHLDVSLGKITARIIINTIC